MTVGPMLKNVGLGLSSVLLAVVAAEVGLAVLHPIHWRVPGGGVAGRELLHQRSSIDGLGYELRPEVEIPLWGGAVKTDAEGRRIDGIARDPGPAGTTIAAVGDSFTFGFGVRGDQAWPHRLERILSEQGYRSTVHNYGVGGYSIHDQLRVLDQRLGPSEVDAVVAGYFLNDPEREPVQPLQSYFAPTMWWQRWNLLRLGSLARRKVAAHRWGDGDMLRYLHREPESVAALGQTIQAMGDLSRERGLPVFAAVFPMPGDSWADYPYADLHLEVLASFEAAGIPALDLLPEFKSRPAAELALWPHDPHPSATAHELTARVLATWLSTQDRWPGGE